MILKADLKLSITRDLPVPLLAGRLLYDMIGPAKIIYGQLDLKILLKRLPLKETYR